MRKAVRVTGIVQGVGFRPFVYRLATERNLTGKISNTAAGVTIEIEGPQTAVDEFLRQLPAEAPPLAKITGIAVHDLPCNGDREFRIEKSEAGVVKTLISPDVAICDDCLRELFDSADRRYRYPFINCTNCGPRFTIVRDIPYDRPRTSMAVFPMCAECQAEYDDPRNRRFHAQPNACWTCGPQVEWWDARGQKLESKDPIADAATALKRGLIVAVKGLGGFHLAADATNAAAVHALRERKRRVEKPFAVMIPNLEAAERFCAIDPASRAALLSAHRPVVLLPRKQGTAIAQEVAPFNHNLGIFLPYAPLQHVLFAAGNFDALVMTSANLSEEPIVIGNEEAVERLGSLADFLLVHNREILLRCDDSVVRSMGGDLRQLRRSRGYVPVPVFLKSDLPPVLAVGGELKNAICLTQGDHAFLSQHIGDLENLESYKFFEEAVEHLTRILEIRPEIVAHDLHPDYFSTKWALRQRGVKFVGVQHHHAHIASCMAEHHLEGTLIGIALDGTGYGTDGTIWGGEVLLAGFADFERAAHLEYVPLPGGEAAIREPWRMAVSYLARYFGESFWDLDVPFVRQLDRSKAEGLLRMMVRGVNSPLTSSCGRLFDAVAALAGIRTNVNYEAQAAIELEMAADSQESRAYPFHLHGNVVSARPMFEALVADLKRGTSIGAISARFHNGLAEALARACDPLRAQSSRVCLSGGTLQNRYLLERVMAKLKEQGFEVYAQREVPAGDGGLALGQAMVAGARSLLPSV